MQFPIGRIIAGLRKTKRIRQSELADRAGLKQPSLSRIENGLVEPRQGTLTRICDALNYSIGDLFSERIVDYIDPKFRPISMGATDLERAPIRFVKMPLVDMESNPDLEFDTAGYPSGVAEPSLHLPADDQLGGRKVFAMRVNGDSMHTTDGGNSFSHGDIAILDDSTIQSGDFVFVRSRREGIFRQVFFDGDNSVRLLPLNRAYAEDRLDKTEIIIMKRVIAHLRYLS